MSYLLTRTITFSTESPIYGPATHGPHGPQSPVSARALAFLQFTWQGNRRSTGLQGISARAMASICVHRALRTPSDIAPRHIGSRDVLQEARRPDTELPHTALRARLVPSQCPVPHFPAIHLTRQSPFYGPPGHISSRDGTDLCPSSSANPSRQHSRAHPLARWFAGRTPTCHRAATHGRQSPVSGRLGPVSTWTLTFLQITWHGNRHSTSLQGTSARAMASICVHRAPRTPPDIATRHISSRDD